MIPTHGQAATPIGTFHIDSSIETPALTNGFVWRNFIFQKNNQNYFSRFIRKQAQLCFKQYLTKMFHSRLETRQVQHQGNIFTECENDGLEDRAFSASVDLPKEKWPTDKSKWKKLSRNKNIFPVPMKLKRGPKPKFE